MTRFLDLHCEDAADVVVTGSRHLSAIAAAAFDCSRLVWMADWRRRGSRCWMLVKTPSLHTARCCFVSRQILFLSVENNCDCGFRCRSELMFGGRGGACWRDGSNRSSAVDQFRRLLFGNSVVCCPVKSGWQI